MDDFDAQIDAFQESILYFATRKFKKKHHHRIPPPLHTILPSHGLTQLILSETNFVVRCTAVEQSLRSLGLPAGKL